VTDFHYDANMTGAGDGSKSMLNVDLFLTHFGFISRWRKHL